MKELKVNIIDRLVKKLPIESQPNVIRSRYYTKVGEIGAYYLATIYRLEPFNIMGVALHLLVSRPDVKMVYIQNRKYVPRYLKSFFYFDMGFIEKVEELIKKYENHPDYLYDMPSFLERYFQRSSIFWVGNKIIRDFIDSVPELGGYKIQ